MGIIYTKGDIVFFRNVLFYDKDNTSKLDLRLNGHPFVLLNDVDDIGEPLMAFKMTSRKLDFVLQYELRFSKRRNKRLKEVSYINLDKIYLFEVKSNIPPVANLSDTVCSSIIEKTRNVKVIL